MRLALQAVVLAPLLPAETPAWIFIPVMILAGMLMGALWGFIPGYLKAKFNVNEIISTLMLNYISIAWVNYWIFGVWSEGGFQMSPKFPDNAWLPRLLDYADTVPILRGLTTHAGLLIGIIAAIILWLLVYRSRWGYEIRLIGDNPNAARYAGINITRNTILVMMLSGALAGLGRHERDHWCRPPFANLAYCSRVWLYGHYRSLAIKIESVGDYRCFYFVRRTHPGWA